MACLFISLSRSESRLAVLVLNIWGVVCSWLGKSAGRLPGRRRQACRARLRARGGAPDRRQPQHVSEIPYLAPCYLLCCFCPPTLVMPRLGVHRICRWPVVQILGTLRTEKFSG
jgi:hypothetical protein